MNSLKKDEGVPFLNFAGSPGVPLLNFEWGPGSQDTEVPLLGSWSHVYTMPCKKSYLDSLSVPTSLSLRSTSFGDGELNEIKSNDSILNKKNT